jgi:hypothetical protein
VAVALAAGATTLAILGLWGPLHVRTDIVGNPILSDFNIYNYVYAYYLVVGFFPIAALLLFVGLTRVGPRIGLPVPGPRGSLRNTLPLLAEGSPLDGEPALTDAPTVKRRTIVAIRVAFVGSVVGLEAGIAANAFWRGMVLGLATYTIAVILVQQALARWGPDRWSWETRVSAANAIGAPLTLAGLFAVSSITEVQILSNGEVRHYPWFPLWLALPVAATLLAVVVVGLRRVAAAADTARIERRALLLIAAPVSLFLLLALLPGDAGSIDTFEVGQKLVSARLVGDGWFPWRDVVVAHGLLEDVIRTDIGFALFGHSYWGFLAGSAIFTNSIYFISFFFLSVYLFGRNWLFLLLIALLILGTPLAPEHFRFVLWPLILLMLAGLLDQPTPLRSVALAFVALGQTILTPEAVPGLLAIAVVIPLYELYSRQPDVRLVSTFRRTLWFAGALTAFAAAFAVYLASRGALDDFVYISYSLTVGHFLIGALPPGHGDASNALYYFAALSPLAALLISFAYAVTRLRLRLRFRTEDWVMAAVGLFVLIYYAKFLARMDFHALEPYSVAMPLILYIVYRLVTVAEREIRARGPANMTRYLTSHPVTLAFVVVVGALYWGQLSDRVTNSPAYYRPGVQEAPEFQRVGYTQAFNGDVYRDLKRVIDAYLGPHDRLFDFTDEPGLFFYFMGRDPSTRYFQVSTIALTADLQTDLIARLRKSQPKLIVLDNTSTEIIGMSSFDGFPTTVHLYDVSQWILDHYRPLLATHGHTIYARRDMPPASKVNLHLSEKPVTRGVAFLNQPCNWGYAPTFLSGPGMPGPGAKSVDAQARPAPNQVTIVGWAGDPAAKLPAREVIATLDGKIVGRAKPELERPDVVAYGLPRGFLRTGFQMQVAVPSAKLARLRVFGVARHGHLTEIVPQGGHPAHGTIDVGGRTVHIDPKAVYGQINRTTQERGLQINLPSGSRWADYRWLEVDAGPGGFRTGQFGIYDRPTRPSPYREIYFQTLDRSPRRYMVPVGSCPQWHGYRGRRLFLSFHPRQDISALRLIR